MDNSLSKEATDWREGRRLRAWELKQEGWTQQRIADARGVSKGSGEPVDEAGSPGRSRRLEAQGCFRGAAPLD
jgi:hypothetical protein